MLLVVQHPFVDLRSFLGTTGKIVRPSWPSPSTNQDFIRSFGQVRDRAQGGIKEWAGEGSYCLARSALRFPDRLRTLSVGSGSLKATAQRAFRRLHSDGLVSRTEIGLGLQIAGEVNGAKTSNLLDLIRDCMQIPVKLQGDDRKTLNSTVLGCAGALARNYLRATTEKKKQYETQPWWVSNGNAAFVLESPESSALPLSRFALKVMDSDGVSLFHDWLQFGQIRCSGWFLETTKPRTDALRRLRLHLMRLHAERECLRLTLVRLNEDKLPLTESPVTDLVQDYLNNAIRSLQRVERFGMPQSDLFEAALQAVDVAVEGQSTSLDSMRRQVIVKLKTYLKKTESSSNVTVVVQGDYVSNTITMGNVSVQGDFNVVTAKNITSSFNKATSAEINEDLKERLKELNVAVAKLAAKLPPDKAEEVSKDVQALTTEAASKEPRKKWYELSAEGLVEAAKAVAEMATPIATAVSAVLALLA